MKNTIPLIMAVLLGLAAVFSVHRTIAGATTKKEATETMVVASVKLSRNKPVAASMCGTKTIPKSAYLPGRHILSSQIPRIEGVNVLRDIPKGSYVLFDDLQSGSGGQSDMVGFGEFVVAVKFQNSPLLAHLKPLDEIAIAAMQNVQVKKETGAMEENRKYRYRTERRLSVLFPYVKVLDVSDGSVLVSAEPQKALQLIAASQSFPLYPLLRRTGDLSNNMDVGVGGSVSWEDLTVEKLSGTP